MKCAFQSLHCLQRGLTATSNVNSSHLLSRVFMSSKQSPCHPLLRQNAVSVQTDTYGGHSHRTSRTFCSMISNKFGQCRQPHDVSRTFIGHSSLNCGRTKTPCKNLNRTPLYITNLSMSAKGSHLSTGSGVLKNQTVLQLKRPSRKKVPKLSDEAKTIQINNVVAYAVAEEIDLIQLEKHLVKQGLYLMGELPHDVTNALHVRGKYIVDQKPKEIFVFEDGSVVFWCVPEVERGAFLKMLSKYSQAPYLTSLVLFEREEMNFAYVNGKTSLAGDIIQLKQQEEDSLPLMLELYTFSNALTQSVKLAIWEASFNKFVDSIEKVTEDLRHGHKISMSRRQVLMKTGELFSLRHLINLSSDLLDTPDFYWDRESLEPLYQSLCNYLNISRRTRVMNEKLNHCCELTELLSSQLNDAHHTRLEVMIIVLILVEVVFEIVHFGERYWNSHLTEVLDHQVLAAAGEEQGNVEKK